MGIMEKKLETTISGFRGLKFRAQGFSFQGLGSGVLGSIGLRA